MIAAIYLAWAYEKVAIPIITRGYDERLDISFLTNTKV